MTRARGQKSGARRDSHRVGELMDNLARAFDRIADFQAVQARASADELFEAVLRLQESVGIADEPRAMIVARLPAIAGSPRASGDVLLGLMVGLMAAELGAQGPAG